MPIYEFSCKACSARFEALVRGESKASCPACRSQELERLLSLPTVQSSGTRAVALASAKKREAARATENMHTQRQYEESHDRHG